jgi:hypothetical protein
MSVKRLPRVAEWDVLLNHAAAEVQGVLLAQLTAYAVNDDVEIIVEMPGDGIGWASVLGMGWSTLCRMAPSLLRRKIWRASMLARLLSLPLMRQSSGQWHLMAMLVVRTSHRLVLVGLDVVLECLIVFHGGGMMTSSMQHVIAKLQLYSCFADVLLRLCRRPRLSATSRLGYLLVQIGLINFLFHPTTGHHTSGGLLDALSIEQLVQLPS